MYRENQHHALSRNRKVVSVIKNRLTDIRELFFPRCCAVCGKRLALHEMTICTLCFTKLPFTEFHGLPGNPVERIFYPDVDVERANALIFYQPRSDVRFPILLLKYYSRAEIGIQLGRLMAADLRDTDFFDGVDAVVPVPLSAVRKRRRGYNQSEKLCRGIAEATNLPVWTDVLKRVVDNATQTCLTYEQRVGNVEGIFRCTAPEKVRNKHLLLVDDVITTGSTLKSCIGTLTHAGDVTYSILSFGITASPVSVPGGTDHNINF